MAKSITLADIARKSKVSTSTVSMALRNKPGLPEATRRRVLEAAQALGYKLKTRAAAPLVLDPPTTKLNNLGLLIKSEPGEPPQANPFYSYVLAGIEEACRQRNINLLYATLAVDRNNVPVETPRLLTDGQVDGLLLVGAFVDETLVHVLGERASAVVLVDAYAASDRYDAVVSDNRRGAQTAAQYLISRGHRQIGLVGTRSNAFPSLRERREGFLETLREQGLQPQYLADENGLDTAAAVTHLLQQQPHLTALFGCNDAAALDALRAAQKLGRHIPGDLSLIGFDDIDLAQHVTPALTTMRVDKVGMGRVAVQLLRNRVEFPHAEQVTTILRPRLIERDSVANPRA